MSEHVVNLEQWLKDHRLYPCDYCTDFEPTATGGKPVPLFPDIDLAYCMDCGFVFCKGCRARHNSECDVQFDT